MFAGRQTFIPRNLKNLLNSEKMTKPQFLCPRRPSHGPPEALCSRPVRPPARACVRARQMHSPTDLLPTSKFSLYFGVRRRRAWVQIAVAMLSGNSLRQTVHTHCASVHQAAKLVAALLSFAEVTAGLTESNGSLPPGL